MADRGGDPFNDEQDLEPSGSGHHTPFASPQPGFLAPSAAETPRESYVDTTPNSPNASSPFLPAGSRAADAGIGGAPTRAMPASAVAPTDYNEKRGRSARSQRRRPWWIAGILAAIVIIILAVILPVYFVIIKPKHHTSSSAGGGGSGGGGGTGGPGKDGATTGGNGSTITLANGTTFTYINNFGGFWVDDPTEPFNDNAQPNSWTPPLNTSWDWSSDRQWGVNLGGWFVLEPFITPALYQKYQNIPQPAVDEWTLSEAMSNDTASGGLSQIETHYDTFITEEDIAQIAGAGLNWVRIPIPYWAIETWPGEPFLEKTAWPYILRALGWCRKYGLRVNLDLHTAPGSQNGFNHSGKLGQVDVLNGVMGLANVERVLEYIRIIVEFISQPEYANLIQQFGILNEPLLTTISQDSLGRFYYQAHEMIRNITGYGEGHGPFISIHDGFQSQAIWYGFMSGSDRVILDSHPYFAFDNQPNTQPVETWATMACNTWQTEFNASNVQFGVTSAGEFSVGFNDCGMWLNGVGNGASGYGGNCDDWTDASQWNATTKQGIMNYALAEMDALQNWFFWTWKIAPPDNTTVVQSPLWSYQLGLEFGYVPSDPRSAAGTCESLGVAPAGGWNGSYAPWMTGGAGAGTIVPTQVASWSAWPPPTVSPFSGAQVALMPTYTATGSVPTLPAQTITEGTAKGAKTTTAGDGWFDAADTAAGLATVGGCTYPDAWNAVAATLPTAVCTGPTAAAKREMRRTAVPAASEPTRM